MHFDKAGTVMTGAIAGHPPPLRLPTLQTLQADASTLPLGLDPNLVLSTGEASLGESDGVLVYTDGATDVRRAGAILGEKGLLGLLAPLADLPARALVNAAQGAILEWTDGPVRDDLCILVLRPRAS
jgi:serine phosphatase RsbU (regulator of sigma subunit)